MRAGRIIARGSSGELRAQAGTSDLEEAFLRLSGEGGGAAAGDGQP
jgi:hypothetical protein